MFSPSLLILWSNIMVFLSFYLIHLSFLPPSCLFPFLFFSSIVFQCNDLLPFNLLPSYLLSTISTNRMFPASPGSSHRLLAASCRLLLLIQITIYHTLVALATPSGPEPLTCCTARSPPTFLSISLPILCSLTVTPLFPLSSTLSARIHTPLSTFSSSSPSSAPPLHQHSINIALLLLYNKLSEHPSHPHVASFHARPEVSILILILI